jgi:hypothetical protein
VGGRGGEGGGGGARCSAPPPRRAHNARARESAPRVAPNPACRGARTSRHTPRRRRAGKRGRGVQAQSERLVGAAESAIQGRKAARGRGRKAARGRGRKAARGRCRHESNKWRGDAGCLIGACSVWRPGSGRDRGHGHETGDMVTRQGAWSRGRQGLTGATRQSEYFLVYSKRLFKAGVRMVGGCCGTRSRPRAVLPPRFLRLWRAAATCATEGCMDTRARGAFSRVRRAVVTASARAASRYTWRRCGTDQVQVEDGPGWCIKYSSGAAHAAADYAAAPEWMGSRL